MININPHKKKKKGLVTIFAPRGEIIWVYLDIVESHQWTTVTNRKHLLAMWWVFLQEKLRKPLSPIQKMMSLLSLLIKMFTYVKDSIQQAILEIVWRAGGKLPQASQGDNRVAHEATRGKAKGALLLKSSSKRQRSRTINSLPF